MFCRKMSLLAKASLVALYILKFIKFRGTLIDLTLNNLTQYLLTAQDLVHNFCVNSS